MSSIAGHRHGWRPQEGPLSLAPWRKDAPRPTPHTVSDGQPNMLASTPITAPSKARADQVRPRHCVRENLFCVFFFLSSRWALPTFVHSPMHLLKGKLSLLVSKVYCFSGPRRPNETRPPILHTYFGEQTIEVSYIIGTSLKYLTIATISLFCVGAYHYQDRGQDSTMQILLTFLLSFPTRQHG